MESFWTEFARQFPTTPGAFAGQLVLSILFALLASRTLIRTIADVRVFDFGLLVYGILILIATSYGLYFRRLPMLYDVPFDWDDPLLVQAAVSHVVMGFLYLFFWYARRIGLIARWFGVFSFLLPLCLFAFITYRAYAVTGGYLSLYDFVMMCLLVSMVSCIVSMLILICMSHWIIRKVP